MSCVSVLRALSLLQGSSLRAVLGGGGWIFGHLIDGLQAEYARVPFADNSVYKIPEQLSDEQVLFLADILPTSFEVGVLNGKVTPGDVVAIVGAGPIGLAAILTASLYTPGRIVSIDLTDSRLESAKRFGADTTINNGRENAVARIMELTDGLGADVALEAVGVPDTFELATELIRPGGRVANIGVHGKPATLHLEKLWTRDVTITTGLVDTNSDSPADEAGRQRSPGPVAVCHPSLAPERHDGRLRHVRRRRQHRRPEDRARGWREQLATARRVAPSSGRAVGRHDAMTDRICTWHRRSPRRPRPRLGGPADPRGSGRRATP